MKEIPALTSELLRHEFPDGIGDLCSCDERSIRNIYCEDCLFSEPCCEECFITDHRRNPFHWAWRWDNDAEHGVRVDISKLRVNGYAVPLGHHGLRCPVRESIHGKMKHGGIGFTVVAPNGIHGTILETCKCDVESPTPSRSTQLLRAKLFPATTKFPITAFAFPFLRAYRAISFRTKCSAHDYLRAFQRLSDNLRPSSVSVRYISSFPSCV